ncbi:MAG: sigma-70 family RNA polymerase sigma factor [Verrucomicrobiales bacterium]
MESPARESLPDEANFVDLLTRHQSLIHHFILSLMPRSADVEDVMQEVNLVLWKKRQDFQAGTNFKAWALTICRFQVMAHRKKFALRRTDHLTDEILNLLAIEAAEQEVDEVARKQEALKTCFAKLSGADRDLLIRRYWEERPLRDFATLIGKSEQGLKNRLHRLRALLRKCVHKQLAPHKL